MKQVHILNGDSLKLQLRGLIDEFIVARECLIDGNIQGKSLDDFYLNRANFIAEYDGFEAKDYYLKTVPELEKINSLPADCNLVCWFEDDLFCQTNFWFVAHLLANHTDIKNFRLVRPNKGNEYSFASMSKEELVTALDNSQSIDSEQLALLTELWRLYQQKDHQQMLAIANQLHQTLPFLIPAIEAQQRRTPDEHGLGYPERKLLAIMEELNSVEFVDVFRAFSAQEGIYSFGDLQVKQMFDRLIEYQQS